VNEVSGPLAAESAAAIAELILDCVHREYPNQIAHSMCADDDIAAPHLLTPAFFGCYDWHSAVHGHWSLLRLLRWFPDGAWAPRVRQALARSLTTDNLAAEHRYLSRADRRGFERPYGLAWLLQLGGELRELAATDSDARQWCAALQPLEDLAVTRFSEWLPQLSHPVRSGVHSQTAFGLSLAYDWAQTSDNTGFAELLRERSLTFFRDDCRGPLDYEPGGHDFLSPCLSEADLMRRMLPPDAFSVWLDDFLPGLADANLVPLRPETRTDGQLAHLDGLNLSRAWMLQGILSALATDDSRRDKLRSLAVVHADAGLEQVNDRHYETAHWLGTFAVYLLTGRGLSQEMANTDSPHTDSSHTDSSHTDTPTTAAPDAATPDAATPHGGQSAQSATDEPWIRLDHFLKRTGLVQTGGHAKYLIQGGDIQVNGCTETRRGRKLRAGDRVTMDHVEHSVEFA